MIKRRRFVNRSLATAISNPDLPEGTVFRSLFGENKKQQLMTARLAQFREAWLMANRSILAVKSAAIESGERLGAETIVENSKQWIRDAKVSFDSNHHRTEQLTNRLLPLVQQVYAASDHFVNDADVSSAHNSTTQRMLELMTQHIQSEAPLHEIESSEDLTEAENTILAEVATAAADYWETD